MGKILVIGKYYSPYNGGVEANTAQVCECLAAAGHQVTVVVNNHTGGEAVEQLNGVTVVRRKVWRVIKRQPISLNLLRGLDFKAFDVIHFHSPNPFAAFMLAAKCMLTRGRPVIITTHHMDIYGRRMLRLVSMPFSRFVLRRSAAVVVTSLKNSRLSADLPPVRSIVAIPLAIDPSLYVIDAAARERAKSWRRELAGDAPLIGFVGRLARYKGLDLLVRALGEMPGVHAVIAGIGPLQHELYDLARSVGVEDRVHILGEIDHDEKLRLLSASDAFAFPSTEITEAFGFSQLEAMMIGVPVVATKLPTGVTDIAIDGQTALLAEVGDVQDLARQLTRMLADRPLALRLAEQARAHVIANFTEAVVSHQIIQLFDEHVERSPR